jgi:hypothetical protein
MGPSEISRAPKMIEDLQRPQISPFRLIDLIPPTTVALFFQGISGFLEEPRDISVYVGQKVHFACHVAASPPARIRWLKDERPLQIDELRMTILPSGALEIDEAMESDQGSYR